MPARADGRKDLAGTEPTPRAATMTASDRSSAMQLGWLWGFVAATLLLASPLAPQLAASLPACVFKTIAGLPCLGCGTTRAAVALARLDLLGSLAENPLAAVGWIALVGGGLLAGSLALLGVPLRALRWRADRAARWLLVTAVLANWVYLVWAGA